MTSEAPKIHKIIHVDMDAFYASVEQRDEPRYRGKPVVVGGTPEQRGVVAAASYEAREYGIHSSQPSRTALKLCPQVIFIRPRFDAYRAVSEQIHEIFHQYTDLVEPLALDEAYLDVTTNKKGLPSATLMAKEIKERIFKETGLTASAGVSINKFLAKTASQVNKPNGLFLIPPEAAESYVAQLAIEKFYGIGEVTAEKMRTAGILNGADLKRWTEIDLVKTFGKMGSFYFRIVRGMDDRPVTPNRVRKSIGAEESFARDLSKQESIDKALREIAETVMRRLEQSNTFGRTLTLKVKYSNYQQVTRSRTLSTAIRTSDEMAALGHDLLSSTEAEQRHLRLLGLSVSNLDCEGKDEEPKRSCVQLTLEFS